jgi:carboxyl-terminal processing protease
MKNILVFIGVLLAAMVLMVGTFSAGVMVGRTTDLSIFSEWLPLANIPPLQVQELDATPSASEIDAGTPIELKRLFRPFWESWDLVKEYYVGQPVDEELMMRGAIRGMLESLGDEHTSYLDPEMYARMNDSLEGQEYEGIGAWVDISGDYLTIISPMPGSPAEKAGLRPDDKVIAIDGEDMTGIDGQLVRQRVLGPKGSAVVLTILREGVPEPFDVEVIRDAIDIPMVTGRMLDDNIAYVRLSTFGDDATKELKDILKDLMNQNPDGLILDLRYNGGGLLGTAIDVVSQFIGHGDVMIEEFGDGRVDRFQAKRGGFATEIPLVVLINEGSASASEIVAGAVQDLERGYLVGTTSYGKGSVQVLTALKNDEGAVRITVARWLTPEGRQINEQGLTPDFNVEITQEDLDAGKDPQLDKAVEVLLKKLVPPPTPVPSPTPALTPTP